MLRRPSRISVIKSKETILPFHLNEISNTLFQSGTYTNETLCLLSLMSSPRKDPVCFLCPPPLQPSLRSNSKRNPQKPHH